MSVCTIAEPPSRTRRAGSVIGREHDRLFSRNIAVGEIDRRPIDVQNALERRRGDRALQTNRIGRGEIDVGERATIQRVKLVQRLSPGRTLVRW